MSMISARIERLPFSRFHTHLLLMGGLGYAFDAIDAAVLAFILPVLRTTWNLSSVQIGVLGSSTYIGFLFGALLAGPLGGPVGPPPGVWWGPAPLFAPPPSHPRGDRAVALFPPPLPR